MPNSLFGRLLIASLLLLGLFFGLVYYAVDQAYISNTYDATGFTAGCNPEWMLSDCSFIECGGPAGSTCGSCPAGRGCGPLDQRSRSGGMPDSDVREVAARPLSHGVRGGAGSAK